ncbi:MAG: peptidoglycan DD-metalloendopeptidase family protein [Byssovorax sp.]
MSIWIGASWTAQAVASKLADAQNASQTSKERSMSSHSATTFDSILMRHAIRLTLPLAIFTSAQTASAETDIILCEPFDPVQSVTCGFGCYSGHKGLDYGNGTKNLPILLPANGTLTSLENNFPGQSCSLSFGNHVRVTQGDFEIILAHMRSDIQVSVGPVDAKNVAGYVSNTGYTLSNGQCNKGGGYHLHLEVRKNGVAIDPQNSPSIKWGGPDCGGPTPCTISSQGSTAIEEDQGCLERGGKFWSETSDETGHCYTTYTSNKQLADSYGKYRLSFAQAGNYQVDVCVPNLPNLSQSSKYVVRATGANHDVMINQSAAAGTCATLGLFAFSAGGDQHIRLDDNTGEAYVNSSSRKVAFGSILITPQVGVGACATPPCEGDIPETTGSSGTGDSHDSVAVATCGISRNRDDLFMGYLAMTCFLWLVSRRRSGILRTRSVTHHQFASKRSRLFCWTAAAVVHQNLCELQRRCSMCLDLRSKFSSGMPRCISALTLTIGLLASARKAHAETDIILCEPFNPSKPVTGGFVAMGAHDGLDYANTKDLPILSPANGTVTALKKDSPGQLCVLDFGNYVKIVQGDFEIFLAHMRSDVQASIGPIDAGSLAGYVSNTGFTKNANGECKKGGGYHLHLEVRKNGIAIDPQNSSSVKWGGLDCGGPTPCTISSQASTAIEEDQGCLERGGKFWWEPSDENGHCYTTYTSDKQTADSYGKYRLSFAQAGNYQVDVCVPNIPNLSQSSKYVVRATGVDHDVIINQSAAAGTCATLGIFAFSAGGNQHVRLDDNTGEAYVNSSSRKIAFGSILITPQIGVGACATPPCEGEILEDAGSSDTGKNHESVPAATCAISRNDDDLSVGYVTTAYLLLLMCRRNWGIFRTRSITRH